MEPWYKVAIPRKEVREGRSFNPDEFAIALEQVVAGTAPEDYRDPAQFFARTCFIARCEGHLCRKYRRFRSRSQNGPLSRLRSNSSLAPCCARWRGHTRRHSPQCSACGASACAAGVSFAVRHRAEANRHVVVERELCT